MIWSSHVRVHQKQVHQLVKHLKFLSKYFIIWLCFLRDRTRTTLDDFFSLFSLHSKSLKAGTVINFLHSKRWDERKINFSGDLHNNLICVCLTQTYCPNDRIILAWAWLLKLGFAMNFVQKQESKSFSKVVWSILIVALVFCWL